VDREKDGWERRPYSGEAPSGEHLRGNAR